MRRRAISYAAAALAVPLTIGGSLAAASGSPVATAGPGIRLGAHGPMAARTSRGAYPAAFVASVESGKRAGSGLAVFSSATGRLERWLVRGAQSLRPVEVSPGGRWVYYVSSTSGGWCAGNGNTQPVLWRVPAAGGRPRQTGLRTSDIAVSPDGRMTAYVSTLHCGHTVWIVVRDQRAGTSRRIFVTRNTAASSYPFATAQLSWAADDTHLAVSAWLTTAISKLFVVDARHASALPATPIGPCVQHTVGCKDQSFTAAGALIFLNWRQATPPAERVVRWQHGSATVLLHLTAAQTAIPGSIAADPAGNAILIQGGYPKAAIWRWVAGHTVLLIRSAPRRIVTDPLWLTGR